jgi:hypothetical protein
MGLLKEFSRLFIMEVVGGDEGGGGVSGGGGGEQQKIWPPINAPPHSQGESHICTV